MDSARLSLDSVVHPRERLYFGMLVFVSLLIYAALAWVVLSQPTAPGTIVVSGLLFALAGFLVHALAIGRIRGNGVLVSERQFPVLFRMVQSHGQRLNLDTIPTVYVLESGGMLNAFAAKLLRRKFVVVHSDVLALALERGEAAVGFIVAHELGHHWRGHLNWRWLTVPGRIIPYLGSAYSRACEYTCDRVGAYCQPDGAIDGLLALAAGGALHPHVNVQEFAAQATNDAGFWIRRAELMSSHPRLPKRVAALLELGVAARAAAPMPSREIAAA